MVQKNDKDGEGIGWGFPFDRWTGWIVAVVLAFQLWQGSSDLPGPAERDALLKTLKDAQNGFEDYLKHKNEYESLLLRSEEVRDLNGSVWDEKRGQISGRREQIEREMRTLSHAIEGNISK
jgi:hypothetical protein